MRKFVSMVCCAAVTMSMIGVPAMAESTTEGAAKAGTITDGTYTSSVQGMNDKVEVSVTITDGKLADVQVTSHEETPGIGGELVDSDGNVMTSGGEAPVTLLPKEMVENNTLNVDSVTGATITSAAIKSAVKDCIEQAGGSADDFQSEITYPANADAEADVAVVGAGGAGLAAAIEAASQGKSVILIEKNGEVGGDTLVCGAIYNTPDEKLQSQVTMSDPVKKVIEDALTLTSDDPDKEAALKEMQAAVQKQWDEYKESGRTDLFDSNEWYALQTWINGDMVANPELVKVLANNSWAGYEWITGMGMKFNDKIAQGAGSLWQRTHTSTMPMGRGFISVYDQQLEKYADKITVDLESTATDLVMSDDGSRVAGVKAVNNHDGSEFTVTAKDGVVIATGGFSGNSDMLKEYNTSGKWPDLSKTATTNRIGCSQGDGIRMATAIGASTTDMDQIQLLYLGNTRDGQLTKYPPRDVNGTDQIIFINKNGERFVQEDARRDQICLAVLQQPDQMFYMLESGDGDGYVDINDPDWRSADGFTFQYLEENGYIAVGDTLDELAEKLGMDADTLKKTVDTYNASVDSGNDEFGRTLFSTKLENGPWVATARQACVHHTMGGVTIDTSARVLDKDGKPIAGLYAGGEVTGGIHGANRLGGNAVVDTVVFGKLSADTLVADSAE